MVVGAATTGLLVVHLLCLVSKKPRSTPHNLTLAKAEPQLLTKLHLCWSWKLTPMTSSSEDVKGCLDVSKEPLLGAKALPKGKVSMISNAIHLLAGDQEHDGDLNEAVNAHFSEGDRNIMRETSTAAPRADFMDVDEPRPIRSLGNPLSLFSAGRNPFSLLDPNFGRSLLDNSFDIMSREPFVSHPREVREVPIELKDGNQSSRRLGNVPIIEDVTGSAQDHGTEIRGTVVMDDEDDDNAEDGASIGHAVEKKDHIVGDSSHNRQTVPSAPRVDNLPDYSNDIEEEMIQAAIEASKWEAEGGHANEHEASDQGPPRQSQLEDAELAHAVSLSLKTAVEEKALHELEGKSIEDLDEVKSLDNPAASNGRQGYGSFEKGTSSVQDDAEDVEEQPLVRHRSRRMASGSLGSTKEVGVVEVSPPSGPQHHTIVSHPQQNGNAFPSEEWGGISSEEHDEAVMLEAAMFGGIPEGNDFHFPYAPHQFMRGSYPRPAPRPPSPSLTAQRLIREQQDDEYLASLQADREKELKAIEEAEAHRLEEQAAKEAALAEERRREEVERQLAAKEASLPQEPAVDDENAVTLLVRMPDGSRRGRRFLKSDRLQVQLVKTSVFKCPLISAIVLCLISFVDLIVHIFSLQYLFDYIDVGRALKPGAFRLVRPYPRRAFSDGESELSLNELGLTNKQEALYLELKD
ncbi:UBX domain [Dillenia turbinata]|uniref:UBX domain n=1 Tax=Dillenia turbinata TaxID=194707 RepID=A0AAN8VKG2_9MAGN